MGSQQTSINHQQLALLNQHSADSRAQTIASSPILTASALQALQGSANAVTQYGLLAGILDTNMMHDTPQVLGEDSCLFFNTMAPSSVFICGSQGSGKSHTLSCLLETCLFTSEASVLPNPLTGLVFHYDTFISDDGGSPCEATYLSTVPGMRVRVLCAPTNYATIRRTYSRLDVEVKTLQIRDRDLNTKRMLDLMAASKEDGTVPLYIHIVHRILREMRAEQQDTGGQFDYRTFKARIADADLTSAQLLPLSQRLSVLESFMWNPSMNKVRKKKGLEPFTATAWKNEPGLLTILDMSCPCIAPETACSLFNICLSIFMEQDISCGRVIALDEAHKYMTSSAESLAFTNNILSTVRLQRHLGARIIIATQEPTVSSSLLDLCSVTIIHRFTSPTWWHRIQNHVSTQELNNTEKNKGQIELLHNIVRLKTGEAIIFAPSAAAATLPTAYLTARIRARLSTDGGRSVLAE